MRAALALAASACLTVVIGGALEGIISHPIASVGLWACVLPAFILLGGISAALWRRLRRALVEDRRRLGLQVILAAAGVAGLSLWIRAGVRLATRSVQDFGLVEPLLGLWSALGGAALLIAGRAAHPRLQRIRRVGWLAIAAGVALAASLAGPFAEITKDIPLAPLLSFGGGVALTAVIFGVARRRPRPLAALLAILLGSSALAAWGLWQYATDGTVRQPILGRITLARAIGRQLKGFGDADGDGHSVWFGGQDCADDDPRRYPRAFDIPGNGFDEDCDGVDLVLDAPTEAPLEVHHPVPPALSKRWNLLFVTVDTVRADHLSLHGYPRPTSPRLDALARHGLVFERAYAPSNSTRHSFPAMLAGRALGDLAVDHWHRDVVFDAPDPLLFSRLKAAGWRTEAVVPRMLRDNMWFGIGGAFTLYTGLADATMDGTSAPALLADLRPRLTRLSQGHPPWAVWAHFTEPHEPYLAHPDHDFGDGAVDRYDAEIASTDAALGALVDHLKTLGVADRTLIVYTSDHGEEFGEHGMRHHGKQVYEETVRVPWIVHVPGAPAVRIEAPVSLIDVPATLTNLMGVPPAHSDGVSHVEALAGTPPIAPRRIFFEGGFLGYRSRISARGVLEWPHKAIIDPYQGVEALFDLRADPAERDNLRNTEPERWAQLSRAITDRSRRHLARRLQRIMRRDVHPAPPADLVVEPQAITPGLTWLGHRLETVTFSGRRINRLRVWVRVDEAPRPDVKLQVNLYDARGRWFRRLRSQPFLDIYPSSGWSPGTVVTITRHLRYAKRFKRPVRADVRFTTLSEQAIFGPVDIGQLK